MTTEWKPDPKQGGEHIEARKLEVLEHMRKATEVALYHVDQQLELDIERLKKSAGETKAKLVGAVKKAESMPALTVVRKYWQKSEDDIIHGLTDTIMRNGE
jgi:hypothetical protein